MSISPNITITRIATYAICVVACLLSACKLTPMVQPTDPGEVKVTVKALKPNTQQSTKNISIDGFDNNSQIGITSISNDDFTANGAINIYQKNIGYKYATQSQYWNPVDELLKFKPLQSLLMLAYYPYASGNNNTSKTTKYFDNYILFDLITKQNAVDDLTQNDLMYALGRGVTQDNPQVNLAFEHKLSKLSFKLKKGPGWNSDALLTQIKLEGANLANQTKLSLIDGSLENTISAVPVAVEFNTQPYTPFRILDTNEKLIDLIVIPSKAEGTLLTFMVNGVELLYTIKQANFSPGVNYTFNVTILPPTPGSDPIPIEPTISNWEVRADIVVEPK